MLYGLPSLTQAARAAVDSEVVTTLHGLSLPMTHYLSAFAGCFLFLSPSSFLSSEVLESGLCLAPFLCWSSFPLWALLRRPVVEGTNKIE